MAFTTSVIVVNAALAAIQIVMIGVDEPSWDRVVVLVASVLLLGNATGVLVHQLRRRTS